MMVSQLSDFTLEQRLRTSWTELRDLIQKAAEEKNAVLTMQGVQNIYDSFRLFLHKPAIELSADYGNGRKNYFLALGKGFSQPSGMRSYCIVRFDGINKIEVRDYQNIPTPMDFQSGSQREFSRAASLKDETQKKNAMARIQNRTKSDSIEKRLQKLIEFGTWDASQKGKRGLNVKWQTIEDISFLTQEDGLSELSKNDRALLAAGVIRMLKTDNPDALFIQDYNFSGRGLQVSEDTARAAQYFQAMGKNEDPLFDSISEFLDKAYKREVTQDIKRFQDRLDPSALDRLESLPEKPTTSLYYHLQPSKRVKHTEMVETKTKTGETRRKKAVRYSTEVDEELARKRYKFLHAYPLAAGLDKIKDKAIRESIDRQDKLTDEDCDKIAAGIWAGNVETSDYIEAARLLRDKSSAEIPESYHKKLSNLLPFIYEMTQSGQDFPKNLQDWQSLDNLSKIDYEIASAGIKPRLRTFREGLANLTSLAEMERSWMIEDDGTSKSLEDLMDYYDGIPSRLLMALIANRKDRARSIFIDPLKKQLGKSHSEDKKLKASIKYYEDQFEKLTPSVIEQLACRGTKGFGRKSTQRNIDWVLSKETNNLSLSGFMLRAETVTTQLGRARYFITHNNEWLAGKREIKMGSGMSARAMDFDLLTLDAPPGKFYEDMCGHDQSRRIFFFSRADQIMTFAPEIGAPAQKPWRYISDNAHFLAVEKTRNGDFQALAVLEEIQKEGQPLRIQSTAKSGFSNEPEIYIKPDINESGQSNIYDLIEKYIAWINSQELDASAFETHREKLEQVLEPKMGLTARIGFDYQNPVACRQLFRIAKQHIPNQYRTIDEKGILDHPELVIMADKLIANFIPDYSRYVGLHRVVSNDDLKEPVPYNYGFSNPA